MKWYSPILLLTALCLAAFAGDIRAQEVAALQSDANKLWHVNFAGIKEGYDAPRPPVFSTAAFLYRKQRRPRNPKIKAGVIMAISGGGVCGAGMLLLVSSGGDDDMPPNQSRMTAGLVLMGAGALLAITGGILAGVGHRENKRMYGLQLVAPKPNEIGLAYHF